MSILDDNSKDIPDGVFLLLSNKLMEFSFERTEITSTEAEDEARRQAEREARNAAWLEREARLAAWQERRDAREIAARPTRHVTNPATGRQVLRNGRIGRALARQE
jgi:hypothetical protein